MDPDQLTTAERAAVFGAGLAVVGAILPWVHGGVVTVTGLDGDGILTLLFGAGAAAIVFARDWDRYDRIGVVILGGLTTLVGVQVLTSLHASIALAPTITPQAGIGLYLTILAGLCMLGAGIVGYRDLEPSAPKRTHGDD